MYAKLRRALWNQRYAGMLILCAIAIRFNGTLSWIADGVLAGGVIGITLAERRTRRSNAK